MARLLNSLLQRKPTSIKIGDCWDALDAAHIGPTGAALGAAFLPQSIALPHRSFDDSRLAPLGLLRDLEKLGVKPVASGRYGSSRRRSRPTATPYWLMADQSDPGTSVISGVDVVALYLGGWTPHVWTQTQINAQAVALMLPIWVYDPNKPGATQGTADGNAAITALQALKIPSGVRVVIDMETYVDVAYCDAFHNVMAQHNYWTTIYGSSAFVFNNVPSKPYGFGGGWWPADWTYSPHIYNHSGVWATQYTDAAHNTHPWDESTVVNLDHLWQHIPVTYTLTVNAKDATTSTAASRSAKFTVGAGATL